MEIKVSKIVNDAVIPTKGSLYAAGYDLYACIHDEDDMIDIEPHQTVFVRTGIAIAIPNGYWGGIYARGGLACKQALRPANCVGVIDSDYRGEILVALHNDSGTTQTIFNGDRIAQLIISPYLNCEFNVVPTLDATARGEGGFGSSGK